MRLFFTCILFTLFTLSATAQDSLITFSKFQEFSSRKGALLKTELQHFGSVKSVHIAKVKTTDVASNIAFSAIRMAPYGTNSESITRKGNFYIDMEDVDSVLQALHYFLAETKKPKPSTDFTFTYSTSNDIQFSCSFNQNNLFSWSMEVSQLYPHYKSIVPGATYSFNKRDIENLIGLIKVAYATPL